MKWFSGVGVGYNSAILTDTRSSLPTSLPADHPPVPSSSSGSRSGFGTSSNSAASGSTASAAARRPPAACPMHNANDGGKSSAPVPPPAGFAPPKPALTGAAKCPIVHDTSSPASSSSGKTAASLSSASGLNPLNSIPLGLSAVDRAPGQVLDLPVERENSTIPRPRTPDDDEPYGGTAAPAAAGPNGEQVWEYPSPQQFYNALVRKGWETPEDSIEVMVAIHNFLNERAWDEVLKWEKRLPGGEHAQLQRFQGRPGELSPKARMHLWAGKLLPSKFNTEPPFDRHDWVVTRPIPTAGSSTPATGEAASKVAPESQQTVTTRYVIDYYSAPPDDHGNPVFHLDVRPALDSFQSISQRVKVGLEEFMKGQQDE